MQRPLRQKQHIGRRSARAKVSDISFRNILLKKKERKKDWLEAL